MLFDTVFNMLFDTGRSMGYLIQGVQCVILWCVLKRYSGEVKSVIEETYYPVNSQGIRIGVL
jgi:hypothetical protein